ncbi:MAG: acyltransferase family protein [Cytophagaceae bacterium]
MKRVQGLDSIRFICAFAVMIGHFGIQNLPVSDNSLAKVIPLINGILNNLSPGIAAVIIFFVISGFCIHYPYAIGKKMSVVEFYIQRILRIALPAITAWLIYKYTMNLHMGVIWSLICEGIYYFIYPLVLRYKHKVSLQKMIFVAVAASLLISFYFTLHSPSYNGDFHRFGFGATWIVGFPIWLLGVLVAEKVASGTFVEDVSYKKLLVLRILVWGSAVVCSVIRFHLEISYAYTLLPFSFIVYYWLIREIRYYEGKTEFKWLAFGGVISYSIYLVHAYVQEIFELYLNIIARENLIVMLFILLISMMVSYLFYWVIEKPSHSLARSIKISPKVLPKKEPSELV